MGAIEELVKHVKQYWMDGETRCGTCDRLVAAAEAELAAGEERVVETELFDGGVVIRQSNGCEERIGLTPAHAILPGAIGNGARFAIRRLPDPKPEPVAVWERPEHAGAPYMCSACSTPLCEDHLGGMCPICALPLAPTPRPWPKGAK